VAVVRAHRLPVRVRGNGDAPWAPPSGGVLIDLGALDRIAAVDAQTGIVRAEAGCSVASLESAARRAGSTLGPLLPSVRAGSVGAWLAGPTRGERGIPGSRRETAALSVAAVLADGRIAESRAAPRSATGPDLDHLALGGEARLCLIAAAWIRLFPASSAPSVCARAPDAAAGVRAVEQLCKDRLAPARARVAAQPGADARVAVVYEGLSTGERERDRARRALLRLGLTAEDESPACLDFARAPVTAEAVEVDASWAHLAAFARAAAPGAADLQLVGLHAGGAFASLALRDVATDPCAAAARASGARVIAPNRLRDGRPAWAELGAGAAWDRLLDALAVEEGAP
jgi:FAD/FMN-containing dehydrogenase